MMSPLVMFFKVLSVGTRADAMPDIYNCDIM